jgi:anti-sigma regulatory factor (Ser/Thr protein kinase)
MLATAMVMEKGFAVERRWNSQPCNIHYAREAIRDFLSRFAVDSIDLIELAIGEACANAVEHGSPAGSLNQFTVRCGVVPERGEMIFEVEDEGYAFPLLKLNMKRTPDLESEGGRGLFLIKQIMDDVALLTSSQGCVIRMTKRIPRVAYS